MGCDVFIFRLGRGFAMVQPNRDRTDFFTYVFDRESSISALTIKPYHRAHRFWAFQEHTEAIVDLILKRQTGN